MRGIGVKEAAAVCAQHFDGDLGGRRALGQRLGGSCGDIRSIRLNRRQAVIRFKILDDSLRHQENGEDEGERKQKVEVDPDEVGPEIPDRTGGVPGQASDEGGRHGDPDRGRDEVMEDEADHLGEIGQRRFPRIVLPVGVGDEAGRGIEGQVRADRSEMLGVER